MAESTTVARPYAQAVFMLAKDQDALAAWTDQLDLLAAVASDQQVALLLGSPRFSGERKAELIIEVCGDSLQEPARNLVRLLIDNRRVTLLPEIAARYRALRAEAERTVEARLVTAQPVDDAVHDHVASALSRRLDRQVNLSTEVDESLIGGAVIHAGDLVIDGSVQGRLARLASAMSR